MTREVRPVVPDQQFEYHRVHLARGRSIWRPLVGTFLVALLTFVIAPLLWGMVFLMAGTLSGEGATQVAAKLDDTLDPTPFGLAYLLTTLATAIPVVWLVNRLLHGQPLGLVTSVAGRMRWGFLVRCLGLSVLALAATLLVSALVPTGEGDVETGSLNEFTTTTLAFLLVVLVMVPFQAAGEEYLFRGYLTQAFGGLFSHPLVSKVLAVLVPAFLFACAHGAQDLPVFVDRFAFGLMAGVLVLVTGGLEAAIAMHVLNNLVAFGLALAFTDIGTALNPTGGTWWSLPATLTQSLVYLALAWSAARQAGVRTVAEGAVLVSSGRPV